MRNYTILKDYVADKLEYFAQLIQGDSFYMEKIKCKECNYEINYSPNANFIIFCPKCLSRTHFECERGYGPVTPCQIYLGEVEIAYVRNDDNRYYLKTIYDTEIRLLQNTYFDALVEASEIVQGLLKR